MTVPKTSVTFAVMGFTFLVLSMLLRVALLPSAALSEINMERGISGKVANDREAMLKLDGFADDLYEVGEKYTATGSMTNNTDLPLKLNVVITLHGIFEKNCWYQIKIGDTCCVFGEESADSKSSILKKQMPLCLVPGETVDVWSSMSKTMTETIAIEFDISAVDSTDIISYKLQHTADTPRIFYCCSKRSLENKKGIKAGKLESAGD
jgi:hypothetical protein